LLFDCALEGVGKTFDISVHGSGEDALIEIEPPGGPQSRALEITRELVARAQSQSSLQALFATMPRLLRGVLGYDRAMIYRFAPDGSGKVIAEAKRRDLESFQGQHFPAADIPQQARALYLKNTIRVIHDVHDLGSALLTAADASPAPIDLSFAHLRSVSPIHLEYLRNMGVSASMSLSIIVGGELWGLVACHHYRPKALSLSERVATETFTEMLSLRIEGFERSAKLHAATLARKRLDSLLQATTAESDIRNFLFGHLQSLRELAPCDGVGVFIADHWRGLGSTPAAAQIPALAALVSARSRAGVWSTHELSKTMPEAAAFAADAAGVMAVPLSQTPADYLFFFRREQVQTLNWGGDPHKVYRSGPHGERLSPRKSFEIWKETVERQSEPWSEIDLQTAEAARIQLLEIMMRHSEILAEQRRAAEVRQKTLNEELNHRVKNILALIKSLVSQDVDSAEDVSSFAATLKGRIIALANAHDQVVRSDGGGVLAALVWAELGPYRKSNGAILVEGPEIALDARAYSVLALVLHELATNAAKYGAFSSPLGRLSVIWNVTEAGDCELFWRETGGPRVSPPKRTGFGSALVRRSVPFDLGGQSEIHYDPEGVRVRLLIPGGCFELRSTQSFDGGDVNAERLEPLGVLDGKRVLLVEDQFVIALDAEQILLENGAAEVDLAATLDEALRSIAEQPPDVAVLDVNLGAGTSLAVADRLAELGAPFIFATGYGDGSMIGERHAHVPVVRKPYGGQALIVGLLAVLEG